MANKRFVIFLGLAIIMSVISAVFILNMIRTLAPIVRHDNPVLVAVAARDIPPFSAVGADSLIFREMPASVVPEGAITDSAQVSGKASRGLLLAGDVIRLGHLTAVGTTENEITASLSVLNDPALSAVMIPLPEGFVVKKGDYLNVVYTSSEKVTKTAIENAPVLHADAAVAYLALDRHNAERMANMLNTGHVMYTISPLHVRS